MTTPMTAALATAPKYTGRSIARCRKCKTATVRKMAFAPTGYGYGTKCQCGEAVRLKAIWGTYSEKPCDGRCTGATGPQCDCQCGGENHGGAHA